MSGIACYLAIAAVVAVGAFLLSEWLRTPGAEAADRPGRVAAVAGLLWPVVVVGAVQCAVVAAAGAALSVGAQPVSHGRVGPGL